MRTPSAGLILPSLIQLVLLLPPAVGWGQSGSPEASAVTSGSSPGSSAPDQGTPASSGSGTSSGTSTSGGDDNPARKKESGLAKDQPQEKKSEKKTEKKEERYRAIPPITWGGEDGKENRLLLEGETRWRVESRRNFGGVMGTDDDDDLLFVRSRFNADLLHRDVVRAHLQILDGRVWWDDYLYPQETHLNLQEAFLEFGNPPEFTSWSLRLGRQELDFGKTRRLIAASNWSNIRRTYDGARALFRSKEMDADLFLVNTTTFNRVRNGRTVTERARTQEDEYFYGGYATLRQWDPHTIEAFFLGLTNTDRRFRSEGGRLGTRDLYTIGSSIYGPLKETDCGKLGYALEGAYQFGHRSEDRVQAWMAHSSVWHEWAHPWKPRLTFLGNLATGDEDPDDGVVNTFNPLFGTAHGPYGIMDFVRLQNLRELAVTGSINPTEKLKLQLEYHSFWRESEQDGWYDGTGEEIGEGDIGRHIGQEISAVANYKWTKWLTTEFGAGHFFSGTAARNSGLGSNANFLYAQAMFQF